MGKLLGIERTCHGAEVAEAVGLHHVEFHAEFLCCELAEVREHAEDANAARKRGGLGEDIVGTAADVVSARSCISAHRHHYGLLGAHLLHGVPYLFGGIGAATGRVDAQHDSLYVVVFHQLFEVFRHHVATDGCRGLSVGGVDDLAVCVVDGYLVVRAVDLFGQVVHVGHRHLVDDVVVADAKALLYRSLYLVGISDLVNEMMAHVVLCLCEGDEAVGIGVELCHGQLSACSHVAHHGVPHTGDIGGDLFAVGVAHVVLAICLGGTLELPHLHYLHLHAHFCQEILEEHGLCGEAVPVDESRGVDGNLVGHRADVVSLLRVLFAVSYYPFAALLEVGECLANGLARCGRVGVEESRFDIYSLNLFLLFGALYGIEDFVETVSLRHRTNHLREGVVVSPLFERAGEIENHD